MPESPDVVYFEFSNPDPNAQEIYPPAPPSPDRPADSPFFADVATRAQQQIRCRVRSGGPDVLYRDIWGSGEIDCYSGNVAATRLVLAIQRHKWWGIWTNVLRHDSGWLNTDYIYREMLANCVSGTHTYRVVMNASARDSTGYEKGYVKVSGHLRHTC